MRNLLLICLLAAPFLGSAQDFNDPEFDLKTSTIIQFAAEQHAESSESNPLDQIEWNAQPEEVEKALNEAGVDFKPYRAHERRPKTAFRQGPWKISIYYGEKGIQQIAMGRDLTGEKEETMAKADQLAQRLGEAMEGARPTSEQRANGTNWTWKSNAGACSLLYRYSSGSANLSINVEKIRR